MQIPLLFITLLFLISCGQSETKKASSKQEKNNLNNNLDSPYGGDGFFSYEKLAKLEFKGGFSQYINFDIDSSLIDSFTLILVGEGSNYYMPHIVNDPKGNKWVVPSTHAQFCFNCENRVAATENISSSLFPNTPKLSITSGKFQTRYRAFSFNNSKTRILPYTGNTDLYMLKKMKKISQEGNIDINLWFSGSNNLNKNSALVNLDFQNALKSLRSIYGKIGIKFKEVRYFNLPENSPKSVKSLLGHDSDLSKLLSNGKNSKTGINLFFVNTIQDGSTGQVGIVLGISGGIPGPALQMGTIKSGVAISTFFSLKNEKIFSMTMAHEMGHFLGLFHSTEGPGVGMSNIHDNIADSPQNNPVNLMFYEASRAGSSISNGQKSIIYKSLWVY